MRLLVSDQEEDMLASERRRAAGDIRRARLLEARQRGTHTQEEWFTLVEAAGHRCLRCGTTERITKDHVVELCRGGSDGIDNIQPLCRPCNSAKPVGADYRSVA